MTSLNPVFSGLSMRRRYEVWFLRLGLADGSGAWWFRYLLMNPGQQGCAGNSLGTPVQVWATWFPRAGKPETFIQGFPLDGLALSPRGRSPFHFSVAGNQIGEDSCAGQMEAQGHRIRWNLQYRSAFAATLSHKGWIGFSRSPHSDATFSVEIAFDGQVFRGEPVGFGVQGHNCGFRHRHSWTWTHAYFAQADGPATTLEALVYEMPMGLQFRKAILWHEGTEHRLNIKETLRDRNALQWELVYANRDWDIAVTVDGSGDSIHRLPYLRTDCSGSFEVSNNSLANASVRIRTREGTTQELRCHGQAVIEMTGDY